MVSVSIIGGSGYAGGELLRILLSHPKVTIHQVTSQKFAGLSVGVVHPNLRGVTNLQYCKLEELKPCDILFVGLPNGVSMQMMEHFTKIAKKVIDLGADFRLDSEEQWNEWYKTPHLLPHLIHEFVYGIPEINSESIRHAKWIAGPGCEAICSILTLFPFVKHNLIESKPIIIDAKMGSSQAGATPTTSSAHAERSRATRSYKPTGHRHTAEIEGVLSKFNPDIKIDISATAIEIVRGILVTVHAFLKPGISDKEIWKALRAEYKDKPFVRIVKEKHGLYRYPEPKILQGANFFDIGWERENRGNRVVIIGAIDNLVKGTSGNGVQCMNLMCGFDEKTGLEFPGLHPV
ncbi:MAG: N-acetyl-gamma-glutamyl-phosphate reductase [Candidatus Roizmanbacteria bacterium]